MNIDSLIKIKPGEKRVFFLRRHPLIFAFDLAMVAALGIVLVAAFILIRRNAPALLESPISRPALILLGGAYALSVWLFAFVRFVDYHLDSWIVTDDRVLNIEQHGLFSRTVAELDLSRIQDVTSEVHGIIPSIFGFGDVHVQTAGEKERFIFEQIPRPHEVRMKILELVEADRKRQGMTSV